MYMWIKIICVTSEKYSTVEGTVGEIKGVKLNIL